MENKPLFHELYGNYCLAVARILTYAVENGGITMDVLSRFVDRLPYGGADSRLDEHMKKDYFLLRRKGKQYETPIGHVPDRPITTLEKQWLCAVMRDPRVRLFLDDDAAVPADVEPLFTQEQFLYYDRYGDGDPYEDPTYRARFRTVLDAIRSRRYLHAEYRGADGSVLHLTVVPYRLEYSEKDDKFRLVTAGNPAQLMNLARLIDVHAGDPVPDVLWTEPVFETETVVLDLTDTHNALERVLLHFSDLRKETTHIEGDQYRVKLRYRRIDEAEVLIRILSFGSVLQVRSPKRLQKRIEERLVLQAMRFLPDV